MLAKRLGIRPTERRDTVVAFATLVNIVAAHAVLETARDTLFLEKLPAEQLPLAFLAIAFLALIVGRLNQKAAARLPRRILLSLTLLCGGVATGSFWWFTATGTSWGLGALYVWTGLFATALIVQFWLQLGDVFDVTSAKRLFSLIGAGALIGALFGSSLAGTLLSLLAIDPRTLLLIASGLFVFAGLLPLGFTTPRQAAPQRRRAKHPSQGGSILRFLVKESYLRRLLLLVFIGAVLATVIDYQFKAAVVVAASREGWNLGVFFARYYALVAGVALFVQLVLAPRLLRSVGVDRVLLILPLVVLAAAVGLFATVGLIPVLLLKGADGTLRFSVHQTATEILFLPLSKGLRERFKSLAAAVGQRGGQAVAAALLLACAACSADPRTTAVVTVVLTLVWIACLTGLRPHYLELFRRRLQQGSLETDVEVPELDLASFESLVSALSSEDDTEVIAALDIFHAYGKTELVPALILYHPSRQVVLRAFELFAHTARRDVLRLMGRLLRHGDPQVRAAALRTIYSAQSDEQLLRKHLVDDCPTVRSTALVGLISAGLIPQQEANQTLRQIVAGDCTDTRLALARALRHLPGERFSWVANELAELSELGLSEQVARSIAVSPHQRYLPLLVQMLAQRDCRAAARSALLATGRPALDHLENALRESALSRSVRRHLPRTISRFANDAAAAILLAALDRERDEAVALKILRGLGRMRANDPSLVVDQGRLFSIAERSLQRSVTLLHWLLVVDRAQGVGAVAASPGLRLLCELLDEKHLQTIAQVFRVLHIVEPSEQFRLIYDGLRSTDPKDRASSRELLSHVVPAPLRQGILAMVDELPAADRLAAVKPFFEPSGRVAIDECLELIEAEPDSLATQNEFLSLYGEMLGQMLKDQSFALRGIVGYHVAELGLQPLREQVADVARDAPGALGKLADEALVTLESFALLSSEENLVPD